MNPTREEALFALALEKPVENRAAFLDAICESNRARSKQAKRHGGGQRRLDLNELEIVAPMKDDELLAVNEALERFSQHAPQKAELVKLRYFAGLGLKEAGQVLGISEPTAVRWWTYSKTWLYHVIQQGRGPANG